MGIEPTWLAWKARALPLSYARWTRVANGNYRLTGDTGPSPPAPLWLRRLPGVLGFQFGCAFLVRLKLASQFVQPVG
jgi:hypothetical protein